jgi:large subunit ribosomal protein L21
MYAVIRAGGKQFRVTPGDVIKVSKLTADDKGRVHFADVLAVSAEAGKIARPNGESATVTGQVVDQGRDKKILVFKFKRKKQYKKMQGHRQAFTAVRITEITFDGNKATAPELAERKPKAKKTEAAVEAAPARTAKKSAGKKAAKKTTAAKKSSKKK